jgi:hypothetical protein
MCSFLEIFFFFFSVYRTGYLAGFDSELTFETLNGLFSNLIEALRMASTYTGYTDIQDTRIYIHGQSGIRTGEPGVGGVAAYLK